MRLTLTAAFAVLLTTGAAIAHPPYTGIRNQQGNSCCGDNDCRVISRDELRYTPADGYQLLIKGTWRAVPNHAVISNPFGDGNIHACWTYADALGTMGLIIHCVFLPQTQASVR